MGVRGQVSSGGFTSICFLTLLLYSGGPLEGREWGPFVGKLVALEVKT